MNGLRILAELTFYPKEVLGTSRKFINKYRPAFKIREDMYNSGQIEFLDKFEVYSGETHVKAYITFPYKQLLIKHIYVGKIFTFCEGHKPLGEGVILGITNDVFV